MDDDKQIARIERELSPRTDEENGIGRRAFIGTAAAVAASATTLTASSVAHAGKNLAASPPAGFSPFNAPGKVVKLPFYEPAWKKT